MRTEPRRSYNGLPTFLGFFEEHIDECEKVARKTGWNEQTKETYRKTIEEKIVPNLRNHDFRSILDLTRADYESALRQVEKQGKGKPGEAFEPFKESTLRKYRFLVLAVVTVAMRYGLSNDVFSQEGMKPVAKHAQESTHFIIPKSLTPSQEIAVMKYLMSDIHTDGGSVALLLMFGLGLRNAEACGVSFSHICEMKKYPGNYYLRIPQTTQIDSNELKLGGKSSNAPRNIPIPNDFVKILSSLLDHRLDALQKEGKDYTDTNLPIAFRKTDYERRCSADDVTEAGRKMFIEIGMRQEDLCKLGAELSKAITAAKESGAEDVFELYEKEPSSYLLRRNFATHMMILGLTESEMMYVIGHEMTDSYTDRSSYTDEKMLMEIKAKMDKRPVLNEIKNMVTQELAAGDVVNLPEMYCGSFRIPTNQVQKVHLEISAKEPGDSVTVTTRVRNRKLRVIKECGKYITPTPKRFQRVVNIQKVYHRAYKKELAEDPVVFLDNPV